MKTALITGASGTIGGALVKKFASEGYFTVGGFYENAQSVRALEEEFKGTVFGVRADLKDAADTEKLFAFAQDNFGHVDALVLNAGVGLYKLLSETTVNEWDDLFAVNVRSAFLLIKKCLPEMIKRKSGKIVLVSSMWGKVGASMEAAYSASKAALIGLTRALAKEVAPSGINVNCVCPGVIDGKMNARFNAEEIGELIEKTPLKRLGTPEDIAELCYFLCSDKADFITGEAISADGGFAL